MFGFFRKRRAIKSFVRDMGPSLRREYGAKAHYTPEEVRRVARTTDIGPDFIKYAFCIYCTQAAFHGAFAGADSVPNYAELRKEVGDSYFGGNTSFDANTLLEADSAASPSADTSSGDSGVSSDSGWDSGGGGWDGGGGGGDFGG